MRSAFVSRLWLAVAPAAVVLLFAAVSIVRAEDSAAPKKIVFLAGPPSHGYAQHEHKAGNLYLAKCISEAMPNVKTVALSGWPTDPTVLEGASTIVIFSDGGGGFFAIPHFDELEKYMKQGVGLVCLHYAVEVPKGPIGDRFIGWLGGYFETFWSVNPHWKGEFTKFPDHPVSRGVKPFTVDDEWYYHMRFVPDMKGVTPILTAIPPDSTRKGRDDAHGGNPEVRAHMGEPEHVGWTYERPDGGRSFGFTGGHWHWNWANPGFRTTVLNAIAWTAKIEVPQGGVPSKVPTLDELLANQDKPMPANFDKERIERMIQEWNPAK
jgi:type 1 glutamine amidotransferase